MINTGITLKQMLREDMNKFSDTLLEIKCLNFIYDNEFFKDNEFHEFCKLFETLRERKLYVLANFMSEHCRQL